jgi:hypothetical protein
MSVLLRTRRKLNDDKRTFTAFNVTNDPQNFVKSLKHERVRCTMSKTQQQYIRVRVLVHT